MINDAYSAMAGNAICHSAVMIQEDYRHMLSEHERPCVLWKPSLTIDGNQWCALYGENLQDGVAGFGDSPADAMNDFDRNYVAKLPRSKP